MDMKMKRNGFSVVELLIVVGVVGIFALVATPELMERQVRSKIAEVRAGQALVGMALESYFIDNDAWPRQWTPTWPSYLFYPSLTTPVAYLGSFEAVKDPFWPSTFPGALTYYRANCADNYTYITYRYLKGRYGAWRLLSAGPNLVYNWHLYDPTNGLMSNGDLQRSQKSPIGWYDPTIVY